MGVDCGMPPFAFIDENTSTVRGFNVDLARLLAGMMNERIKFYPVPTADVKKSLSEGAIDFAITGRLEDKDLQSLDLPVQIDRKFFVQKNCLTITCPKDLRTGQRIVVLAGSNVNGLIPAGSGIQVLTASSDEEALRMVDSAAADAFLSPCAISTDYHLQKLHLTNVKEVGMPLESLPLSITLLRSNTSVLTQISVAYGQITEKKTYDTIKAKWFGQSAALAPLQRYLKFIVAALILFALALLASFVWNRTLKKTVQSVTGELRRSEEKYRDLIEFSPEMIHLVLPDGRISLSNRIARLRLGYGEEEAPFLVDLAFPESRAALSEFISSVFANGHGTKGFTFRSRNEERIEVEMTATTLVAADATDSIACCFSRDVSERKRLEDELMQSERLAILGQMTVGLAHEINNPLGIILANTEELLQDCEDGAKENLQAIERNALRAGKFIDDLLTFTRPSPTTRVRFDLIEAVEESLLLCKQKLRQKGIVVGREFSPEPLWFMGDGNQIQQLMVNLLLNSIQAIDGKGSIGIKVMEGQDKEAGKIILEVTDTGGGIREKDLPRIFDLFYTARKNKGFGLGLFICKRIVEEHDGTIQAESRVGHGTVMRVEFRRDGSGGIAGAYQRETGIA